MRQVTRGQVEVIEKAFEYLCNKLIKKVSGTEYLPEVFEFHHDISIELKTARGQLERRRSIIRIKKNKRHKLIKAPDDLQKTLEKIYFALYEEDVNSTKEVAFLYKYVREHNNPIHIPYQLEIQELRLKISRLLGSSNKIKQELAESCFISAIRDAPLTWDMIRKELLIFMLDHPSRSLARRIRINDDVTAENILSYYGTELCQTISSVSTHGTSIHKNLTLYALVKLAEITKPEDGFLYIAAHKTSDEATALISRIHHACHNLTKGKYLDQRPEPTLYDTPAFAQSDAVNMAEQFRLRPLPARPRSATINSISSAESEEDQTLRANPETLRISPWGDQVRLKHISSSGMSHVGGQKVRARRELLTDTEYAELIDPKQIHGASASSDAALKHGLRRISTTLFRDKPVRVPIDDADIIDNEEITPILK